jgi:hypothetical protein
MSLAAKTSRTNQPFTFTAPLAAPPKLPFEGTAGRGITTHQAFLAQEVARASRLSICSAIEGLIRALPPNWRWAASTSSRPGVKSLLWDIMTEEAREAMYQKQAAALPVGHLDAADKITEVYLYLMRQAYGTEQVVVVDGGRTLI